VSKRVEREAEAKMEGGRAGSRRREVVRDIRDGTTRSRKSYCDCVRVAPSPTKARCFNFGSEWEKDPLMLQRNKLRLMTCGKMKKGSSELNLIQESESVVISVGQR
jgi:hypothetical protein